MNGSADDQNDSSWDALAADLGLEPVAEPKPKPAPPPPPAPVSPPAPVTKVREPDPTPVEEPDDRGFGVPVEVVAEVVADIDEISESDDTVVEDGPGILDDELPFGDEPAGEPGTGKRRRRRRRRKKGGAGEASETPAAAAAETVAAVMPVEDEEPDVLVGEAAAEMDDDDDDEAATPVGEDLEMEDDSTEPLPEWKVVAWTDLIATLYRPQDR